ncbi:hypothetical protein [Aestuariibacter salexigens]|uniref:hypothetical protein n=1 Tax=Aestuariibacter salexigens TaxID=226010 RepID=UPI000429D909|nr:hypothetical protein [Aestuariibacter salexigens]
MFKSLLTAAVVTIVATSAQAVEFVNQDGSPLSQLCIAAVESNEQLINKAKALNISRFELDRISCNDQSLNDFVKQYRATDSNETVNVIAFENANNSLEGQLCIAAATSNQAFKAVRNRLDGRIDADKVSCNGESLVNFAKQFNGSFNG